MNEKVQEKCNEIRSMRMVNLTVAENREQKFFHSILKKKTFVSPRVRSAHWRLKF